MMAGEEEGEGQGEVQEQTQGESQEQAPAVTEAAPVEAPPAAAAPPKKSWFQVRIDELTAKRREIEEQLGAKDQQISLLNETIAGLRNGSLKEDLLPAAEVEKRAAAIAAANVANAAFTAQCNDAWAKGTAAFADFPQAVENLKRAVGDASGGLPQGFLESALATDDPAQVLHALGGNLEEAARIASLPPAKQAIAMTKLAAAPAKPRQSGAPVPVGAVVGSGGGTKQPSVYDDGLDIEGWMIQRQKDIAEGRNRRRGWR